MGLNCACPAAASITGFQIPECSENFGQINKVIFQRVFSAAGTKNTITDPALLTSWTAALAAADGTKCVITPFVSNPTTTPGAPRTYGGGNATPGGVTKIIGAEPTAIVCQFDDIPQKAVIKPLKKMMCENVGVYLINENGQIGCIAETVGETTTYRPIPIAQNTLFIGDKAPGGLENPDTNAIQWSFASNWSDDFMLVTPEFDALSLLVNTI